jgi:hypothetical protein
MSNTKNIKALINEFVKLDNLDKLAKEKKDYEELAKLRDMRLELQKAVYNNIVLPYIPIGIKYNLKNK